jgi:threonyl-tRNA synthetase
MSELSSTIVPPGTAGEVKEEEMEESQALKSEERLESKWFVLDTGGNLTPVSYDSKSLEGFDFSGREGLETFVKYEIAKDRVSKQAPPHIDLMQKLELVDYEPGSDPGNFRFYPKGKMVKSLLEQYVTAETLGYGAMEIESPIMYDYNHPTLKSYLDRFPARQYQVKSPNKKLFLRFAACFGQFLMLHDAIISYKNLPLRLYEMTRYSFRVEQKGELAGLRRLRSFTMPDCHAFCRDMDQAKEEMMVRFDLSRRILTGVGFSPAAELELAIRVTREFWEQNGEFVKKMVQDWGKPAVIEMWEERFFYFIMKYEFNFVDALGKCSALTTDQIDVENGERYGIKFTESDGSEKHPLILHLSPSGAIERLIYSLLEKEHMRMQMGEKGALPFWLAPTQVRLLPVSQELNDDCFALMEKIPGRVDVDDRDEKLGRKIRDAEKEWIPVIVVFGKNEKESGKLTLRLRGEKEQKEMTLEELSKHVDELTNGYPKAPLPLPASVSVRPHFRG